ncbi:MAG: hypothetical protein SFU87_05675 [Chitinophagaceae bacterium]|nr:hypothetical protein [Chitinophagaceae bacterium]
MIRYIILLIIASLPFSTSECQTCIIGRISYGEIVVGADALIGNSVKSETGKMKDSKKILGCKIINVKGTFFAGAGSPMNILANIADSICKKENIIDTIVSIFKRVVKKQIEPQLEYHRKKDLAYFKRYYMPTKEIPRFAELLFFKYENMIPKLIYVGFKITNKSNEKVHIEPISKNASSGTTYAIGHKTEIIAMLNNKETWKNGSTKGIETLLINQINAKKAVVDGPITIIQITKNGINWYKEGLCNEKKDTK